MPKLLIILKLVASVCVLCCLGCSSGSGAGNASDRDRSLAGGDTTSDDRSDKALEFAASNLSSEALARHDIGDAVFHARFFASTQTGNPGLGPLFNNASCVLCHTGNGRGEPEFVTGSAASQAVISISPATRTALPGGPAEVPGLGIQIQDNAIRGVSPEGVVNLSWVETSESYPDGTVYSLRRPNISVSLSSGGQLNSQMSMRTGPSVFGLGLLEAIPESKIASLADPNDSDADGISGRVNMVWDQSSSSMRLGRFGRKANQPSILQQVAFAFREDMGVTNFLFPDGNGGEEIDAESLRSVVFYLQTLAVPRASGLSDPNVISGEGLFSDLGCANCHTPRHTTGEHELPELANQTIYPYTDLLLHDMGPGLADNRPDFEATGSEWRTAPLWGLGIARLILNNRTTYLHDGRARSIEEAILWHGGEASNAKENFKSRTASEREQLLQFLRSL